MTLKTKQVGVYTVSQMGPLESVRLRLFQKQIEELKTEDPVIKEALNEWAFIAACTTPFISREEYLQTPALDLAKLTEAVSECNDDIISLGQETADPKRAKKKKPS